MQLIYQNNEKVSGRIYGDPGTISYRKPPGTYKLIDANNAFKGSVVFKADGKTMKQF